MTGHDIVVIGASAGGVEVLKQLVSGFPADLPAAVLIVLHVSPHGTSVLPHILTRAGKLRAEHPQDGQALERGRIYIAPPDQHLLVRRGYLSLSRGPRENGHRPAVDTLFRSAARTYGSRVIGVVLSGALDDGTAGLQSIKARGGLAVCQEPGDALYASMPQSALEAVDVDYSVPVAALADLLVRLVHEPAAMEGVLPMPSDIDQEAEIAEGAPLPPLGNPSGFACPECGGALWEIHDQDLVRFRCRVGHAYSAQTLLAHQADALEEAFWVALRALEESAALAHRMADRSRANDRTVMAERYEEQARNAEARAQLVRSVLQNNEMKTVLDAGIEVGSDE